jgi:hypothetical protein
MTADPNLDRAAETFAAWLRETAPALPGIYRTLNLDPAIPAWELVAQLNDALAAAVSEGLCGYCTGPLTYGSACLACGRIWDLDGTPGMAAGAAVADAYDTPGVTEPQIGTAFWQ